MFLCEGHVLCELHKYFLTGITTVIRHYYCYHVVEFAPLGNIRESPRS